MNLHRETEQDQQTPQVSSLPTENPAAPHRPHVIIGLMFFPRGGSAHVTRSLARELVELGWKVATVCGSLRLTGRPGQALEFFAGLDARPVGSPASWRAG